MLSFDDLEVARQATLRGWMTQHDWGKEINKLNRNTTKFVRIGIDGKDLRPSQEDAEDRDGRTAYEVLTGNIRLQSCNTS